MAYRINTFCLRSLIFSALISLTCYANSTELSVYTEEMPPYNYTNSEQKVTGFCSEIVLELIKRSDIKLKDGGITSFPWARSYKILQREKNTLLFSTVKSKERENLFKWVGPLASRTIWFWKLSDRNEIKADSIDDIKPYLIGAVRDFASTKYMEELGLNLDITNSEEQNFKKLFAKRFDMLTALELAAAYHANNLGKSVKTITPVYKLDDRYEYYVAVNKKTDSNIIRELQSALDQMKQDGSYEKIKALYLK